MNPCETRLRPAIKKKMITSFRQELQPLYNTTILIHCQDIQHIQENTSDIVLEKESKSVLDRHVYIMDQGKEWCCFKERLENSIDSVDAGLYVCDDVQRSGQSDRKQASPYGCNNVWGAMEKKKH